MPIQNIINDKRYILCSKCPPPAVTHAADRLLRTRPTYSKLVMVSVGVSALGRTNLHFVDPGVKVNGQYYQHILLIREIFCPILSSTRITSHFSRTEPQRIGLNKLSNSWKSRRQTSFHQICGYPTPPISTLWRTLWTQDVTFIIYDILYPNFKTQLSEILLFCSVHWLFCWV